MKILADASLPLLTEAFPSPFELQYYEQEKEISKRLKGQDILFCRSTLAVNQSLLKGHSLRYVATASSGIDHIDQDYLERENIALIDAKGCNKIAVADYVLATIAYLQTFQQVTAKNIGVIGVGEVGSEVMRRLQKLGFSVIGYDPYIPSYSGNKKLIAECDLISIHANLHDTSPYPSRNLLNEVFLSSLKPGTVIINASRGGIVDEEALLNQIKPLLYCTDVYNNEPNVNPKIIQFATTCTPHIAGHSIEAKMNAVVIISQKLRALEKMIPLTLNEHNGYYESKANRFTNWQEFVLSLYNPLLETNVFKNSNESGKTFQTLRKNHYTRHDFCQYYQGHFSIL